MWTCKVKYVNVYSSTLQKWAYCQGGNPTQLKWFGENEKTQVMKNVWSQMEHKSILLCLPLFLCHYPIAAMAQSASYYGIKQRLAFLSARSLSGKVQTEQKVRDKPYQTKRVVVYMDKDRTSLIPTSTQSFPYYCRHCLLLCGAITALWKKNSSRTTANREGENKQ